MKPKFQQRPQLNISDQDQEAQDHNITFIEAQYHKKLFLKLDTGS